MNADPSAEESKTATSNRSLSEVLQEASYLLRERKTEENLSTDEIRDALETYSQLQNVVSLATRTGDWSSVPSKLERSSRPEFHQTFQELIKEFDDAETLQRNVLEEYPAAVRPLGTETLSQVKDFFILDNSLRETTVGAPRGHTLEEKHKIVDCIHESGLEEVILGAFGSKISVDSQIAERWREMGNSFDQTWGFSSLYDFDGFDQEVLWDDLDSFYDKTLEGKINLLDGEEGKPIEYYVPPSVVLCTYSEKEKSLFKKAFVNFTPGAFDGKSADQVLKESESELGRIPMGLLMMSGYGIKNAIIELDTGLEKFDFDKFNLLDRCKSLLKWSRDNLQRRGSGDMNDAACDPRVLINFTDFANWKRSDSGLEEALFIIHELCSLPSRQRPFGFMMEDPSAWLFPDEIGRLIRMMRLMMSRAGYPRGKLLVHIHMHFGMAEANVLTTLVNGADGVWAAMCTTGAQTEHACSTITAVNLFRSGLTSVAEQYNLEKMVSAAREIHTICTREKCPSHQEVYGEDAFDVPFVMTAVPYCRYALVSLMQKMGVKQRGIRLNEISPSSGVRRAMIEHFGLPEISGWDPKYCPPMHAAIHEHLLTGLSRDYNTSIGLGQLYALVSQKPLSPKMIWVMMTDSDIPDYHPTILEFIGRWNRLCAKYEDDPKPLPGSMAKSCLCFNVDVTVEPARMELPFSYFFMDILQNHVLAPLPKVFKQYMHKLVVDEEKRLQGTKHPKANFFDQILRLKLFIEEAEGLGVLPLVDDFVLRKNHDFFFGEDHDWLREVRGSRPKVIRQILRAHLEYYPRVYKNYGNHGIVRCLKSSAKRIAENQAIIDDLQDLRSGESKQAVENVAFEKMEIVRIADTDKAQKSFDIRSSDIVITDQHLMEQMRRSMSSTRYSNQRRSSALMAESISRSSIESNTFTGPGRKSESLHFVQEDNGGESADAFLNAMDEILKDMDQEELDELARAKPEEGGVQSRKKGRKKRKAALKAWWKKRTKGHSKSSAKKEEEKGRTPKTSRRTNGSAVPPVN
mmetsp:Transcript_3379/g.7744  ORF Transcript_3379/g.7744 Transcript_3379/m.7744 type:complete len:1027 (-) Transcript_3379:310-3390(-)